MEIDFQISNFRLPLFPAEVRAAVLLADNIGIHTFIDPISNTGRELAVERQITYSRGPAEETVSKKVSVDCLVEPFGVIFFTPGSLRLNERGLL